MNYQEEQYFHALSRDRAESANTLEKPSMQGIKNSVVEKYSDQAHFVYELLQNADDADATRVRFVLELDRLIFAHNGKRHFSVSDPAFEGRDSKEGKLGDINAITSIANSNKTAASIGKFGVGFKAVFQYTSTPHIYDPEFRFRIDRFIVPTLLKVDFPGRRPEETLFVFPFDHSDRDEIEAYSDISDKLKNLTYPLLFMSSIESIEFEFKEGQGAYSEEIEEIRWVGDTLVEQIHLAQNYGDVTYDDYLWLFSRSDESKHRYSVGFFMDKEGHLRPVHEQAFCFFPTKEETGLNFIIHAPFLLTDSREGIRAGIVHNEKMLRRLAGLAADSLVYLRDIGVEKGIRLIDDSIVDIIPVDPDLFSNPADKRKVSFLPFYRAIREKFETTALLPSTEGYASTENAYWGEFPQLPQLFSNQQLAAIVPQKNAKWVFPSQSRYDANRYKKPLCTYIESLCRSVINEDIIISGRKRDFFVNRGVRQSLESIQGITPKFIEAQSFEWLHSFYKWLSETKHRTEAAADKPFFLDQDGKAAAAFDKAKQSILFLPVKDLSGYRVVHPKLLENPDTLSFVKQIGIREPSLKDQIYTTILPMYREGGGINTTPHFKLFFRYFCKCSHEEVDEFINLIKDYEFIRYYDGEKEKIFRGAAKDMYLPTPELRAFLETKKSTRFILLDEYKEMVEPSQEKQLLDFLTELGIKKEIDLINESIDYESSDRTDLPNPHSTQRRTWTETNIDGCKEIVEYVVNHKDVTKSTILWNGLLKVIETKCTSWQKWNLDTLLSGVCRYFYYSSKSISFTSSDAIRLKESRWLVNTDGEFVSANEVTRATLSEAYDTTSETSQSLLSFLGIQDAEPVEEAENDTFLTDSQKEKIEFADKLLAMGVDKNNLEKIEAFLLQEKARELAEEAKSMIPEEKNPEPNAVNGEATGNTVTESSEGKSDDGSEDENSTTIETHKLDGTTARVVKDIVQRTKVKEQGKVSVPQPEDEDQGADPDIDQDEYTPAPIDYSKRIEKAKQKSASEIEKIAYFEELQNRAMEASKYSYGWFKALLEMESINSGETNSNNREISISFAKVERDGNTKHMLILKHPNRYIPQFMEDLADIPLVLHMGDQTKTIVIEVTNIVSYTLRVKIKNSEDIEGIDLSTVTAATIDAKSPAFLLEELRKQFNELGKERGFEDDYDMQSNLCENIEFVFGPPGTGKTTHLAMNVLLPMMQENADCKVLVLTPTNKSADVLVRRIMEVSKDEVYKEWLVRFGATGDEEIEQSPVFRDKTFDIRTLRRNVTVTTIARFPYDFFMPQGARIFLYGINWDYIVIDEASMIPLANIIFPLYKKTPRKFIIAGDPFQIEPITSGNLWKNENIYTMVKLDSFTDPRTVPHQYEVELLTTQYRSIPDIGYVFSNFIYGGILKHYRSAESQRPLNVGSELDVKTLNIIKFPVSKYESIYRCKRLQHSSSYQVYSALFTFEYVCYLSREIAKNNPGSLFKIGIIAPYRAQADMIDKLLASEKLPKEVDVQVGTIHGFQGDECDIIFAVFNPPPTISASKEMFLNKRNIINVSISRARDYLFIVMPDDNTENVANLRLVKRVEQLVHETGADNEFLSPDLEKLMFGDSQYLENNAFSTSHQNVNVYGLPEKKYEVRTEDTAIDVQIHKGSRNTAAANEPAISITQDIIKKAETIEPAQESSSLDQSVIPKELRKDAIVVQVRGVIEGSCYLVPYYGRIENHIEKKPVRMFIPQIKNGKEKKVAVFVVEEDKIIYIDIMNYRLYKTGLGSKDGIELWGTSLG